jgi:hypothetical protein
VSAAYISKDPFEASPLPSDIERLWTGTSCFEAEQPGAAGEIRLVNKPANDDPLKTLPFTNTSDIGMQYPIIKTSDTAFLGHLAGGASKEYAGLGDGQSIPEVLLGCQFEHELAERQKVLGAVDYAHDMTDPACHRVCTKAAWEVFIAPDKNISLRTEIQESSNKAPSGQQATNLNYSVNLLWKF